MKSTLVFQLFVRAIVDIITLFMTSIIFDLDQVLVTLFLGFFNSSDVTANGRIVGSLALRVFAIKTKIFLGLIQC